MIHFVEMNVIMPCLFKITLFKIQFFRAKVVSYVRVNCYAINLIKNLKNNFLKT